MTINGNLFTTPSGNFSYWYQKNMTINGTITVDGGPGSYIGGTSVGMHHYNGDISVTNGGILFLESGMAINDDIHISADARLILKYNRGPRTIGASATITNNGQFNASAGADVTINCPVNGTNGLIYIESANSPRMIFNNGIASTHKLILEGRAEFNNVAATIKDFEFNQFAVLSGNASVFVSNTAIWRDGGPTTGPNYSGTGGLAFLNTCTLTLAGGHKQNYGDIGIDGPVASSFPPSIVGNGIINVNSATTFTNADNRELQNQTIHYSAPHTKTGSGTITYSGSGTLTNSNTLTQNSTGAILNGQTFINYGTLRLQQGQFQQTAGSFTNSATGIIQGIGTLDLNGASSVTNDGTIQPGLSPGTLTINRTAGVPVKNMDVEVAGNAGPGTGHDLLISSNAINLTGGALTITLLNGFQPTNGAMYTIITGSSVTGTFGSVTPSCWVPTYNANSVVITYSSPLVYRDFDGDGYGNPNVSAPQCTAPNGYVAQAGDCNDNNPNINPSTNEIFCNNVDDDCNAATPDEHPDFDALMALYNATNGANWTNNNGWVDGAAGTDCNVCGWYGVQCDGNGRVYIISLFNNNLAGAIPPDIGNLTNLIALGMPVNQLTGSIPSTIGNLINLEQIELSQNQLTGSLPTELGNLQNLTNMLIGENLITGNIPSSFGNLLNLQQLYLSFNQLSGNIPASLGNLINLGDLQVANNHLTGAIPSSLGNLSNLSSCYFHNNELSGCFDPNLANLCLIGLPDFSNNPSLHLNGDFAAFCNNGAGGCGTDADGDRFAFPDDCDDTNPNIHPGATEICNGIDDNCNGQIDEGAAAPAQITGTLSFCQGGNTTLTASGGNTYHWSTGATTAAIMVNTAGTYTVTVDDGNGCPGTATATVAQLPLPTPSISGNLTFCAGGSTALTATGGVSYTWSTSANTVSINVNAAGTYTVTATGANGCTATTTATVAQLPLPTPSISGNLTFCASGSTALTATGGVLYAWSTGTNTASINVNAAGTYTVTATGANGCTASTTATVAQLPLPTPSIAGTLTFCVGGSTILTASGGNTYHWSTGANMASATVNAAGTYTVTATGAGGCTGTATVAVAQLPLPTPSISGVTNVCAGSSTALTATGGTAYAWSTGATTATVTVNAAATYTVTATGANGCTATATATVAFNTPPNAQISGNTTICAGGTATLTATGGTSYAWSTGANTASINTNVAGAYTATVTGANGCTATASATVTVSNLPFAVSVLGNLAFCAGNTTTLTASGGASYVWNTGANTASITVNAGGAYTVTATNNFGCTAAAIANVVAKPLPTPSIAASPNACAGASTLTASGGTSYTWNTGATTNSISPLSAGTYTATATNQGGCTATATTNVLASPSISCPSSQTVCAGSTTLLSGVPTGGTYSGAGISGSNFNAGTAGIGTHVITYTVTGAGGCSASCTFTMTVVPGPDANITAASPVAANSTGNNASVANAGVGATYAWTIANGTITSGNGTNTIAYTAGASGSVALSVSVGAGGCTASANRSISIGNGPSMICPSGQTVGTDLNACSANLSLAHPAVTEPNPPLTLSVAFGNGSPAPSSLPTGGAVTPGGTTNYVFQSGQTQVTYTAMNGLGQTATCVLNIAVRDQQAPILTCPLTIVRGTDAGQCAAAVSYATPSSTDNCGAASTSLLSGPASGATFPIGTTMVFWQANDAAGNLATCAFSVTVLDNQPPNITCPPNQSLSTHPGRCEAYALYNAPTASDNCGTPSLTRISGLESGGPFPKGLNTIVWQARDAAGNSRTCSFRLIVSDNEAPAIFCPADISVNTTFGTCAAVVTYPMATFTDNCPGGTIARIGGLSSGSSFPVGVTPVLFRATDAGGRSSTCTLRVTVTDNQPPSMACPGNLVATGSGMPCVAQVFYGTPTATDNCSGALTPFLFAGLGSGSSFPAGVTTNMWRAIDGNGLSTDCTFTVTVNCTNTAPRPNGQTALETLAQQRPTLHLAPNPATSSTTLTAEGLGEQGGDILVFDAMGRLAFQHPVLPAEATIRLDFGTATFATGTYRVVLRTERAVVSKTLIIK